ncbi:MAG TPA: NTP transferase domain-containing protein [Actinocrinis sp.]|nr:NTP transferase domain-containing protein [Actinocrinis sp.]
MPEQSDTPRDVAPPVLSPGDPATGFDAVVLAGGAASRLGGVDKPGLEVGGQTLLDAALTACAGARRTVVVGPVRPVGRTVEWAREEPAGAGPAAALAAGLAGCTSPYAIVLAADLPFIDAEVVHSLWTTISGAAESRADGAVAVDESGRAQWLTACYLRSALLARIGSFAPDELLGLSLRRLLAGLRLTEVAVPARAAFDCDTWEQVDAARGLGAAGG